MTYLALSWSISRSRDTYGYNICRLDDTTTGKRYRCSGGGYDMTGTVLADWLTDVCQSELQALAPRAGAWYSKANGYRTNPDRLNGLYGLSINEDTGTASINGACGVRSVEMIAAAIGIGFRATVNRRGHATGYTVTQREESAAAPELLVALREIVAAVEVGDVDGFSPSGTWFREAKAALNKVEGI